MYKLQFNENNNLFINLFTPYDSHYLTHFTTMNNYIRCSRKESTNHNKFIKMMLSQHDRGIYFSLPQWSVCWHLIGLVFRVQLSLLWLLAIHKAFTLPLKHCQKTNVPWLKTKFKTPSNITKYKNDWLVTALNLGYITITWKVIMSYWNKHNDWRSVAICKSW